MFILKLNHLFLVFCSLVFTFSASAQENDSILSKVRKLDVGSNKVEFPVYYSKGFEERSLYFQKILIEANNYYNTEFNLNFKIKALLVLNKENWGKVLKIPYGLYSAREGLISVPATHDGKFTKIAISSKSKLHNVDPEWLKNTKLSFEDAARKRADLITIHELGHNYTDVIGIKSHNRWLREYLASYFSYSFLKTKYPNLANMWISIATLENKDTIVKHKTLNDLEELGTNVGFKNYGWYQNEFAKHIEIVFDAQGIDFLKKIQMSFPTSEQRNYSTAELLSKLDEIQPGFIKWAQRFK